MQKLQRVVKNLLFSQQKRGKPKSKSSSVAALDRVNLSLGDVRDVFEPYLAIFLTADRNLNPAQVGIAISITSIAGILAQTPLGAVVDASRDKRRLIAIATLTVAISYMVIVHFPAFLAVIAAQGMIGISAVIVGPAVAAASLGLVGKERLEKRVGRNEALNHTGNVVAAIVAGILGQFVGRAWIFYFFVILCILTIVSVFQIRKKDIDNTKARADDRENTERASMKDLLSDRTLIIFASSVILFYLANAALLPLVSQELTGGKQNAPSLYVSAAVIVAQLIMIPVATWAGTTANKWGRKPLILIAFAAVLIRALLYTLNRNPWFLVSVQVLDGIASGIFTVLVVVVVADLTQGTGRFNLAQGAINTTIGIGAALSNLGSGFLVKAAGYHIGFMTLAGIAAVGLSWFWLAMPETKKS
ncbi:MAG: MFS transporter [Tolypothrix carrinoi HA7290-LM1]|jgi:MFS family permease|nr:MFS transporter [Tolypothrix carrinoi HA7290-LM1]